MHLTNNSSIELDVKIANAATGEIFEFKLTPKGTVNGQRSKELSSDFTYRVAVTGIGQAPIERNNVTSDAEVEFSINNGLLTIAVNSPTKA